MVNVFDDCDLWECKDMRVIQDLQVHLALIFKVGKGDPGKSGFDAFCK